MKKRGISFIVLIITISILFILLGLTTLTVGNSVQSARKVAFASDLVSLEEAISVYYWQTGEYPILLENGIDISYRYDQETSLVSTTDPSDYIELNGSRTGYLENFKAEIAANLDDSVETVFYPIDLEKLDVKRTERGMRKNGKEDCYMMAYPSQNVYYLKGLTVGKQAYFSLVYLSDQDSVTKLQTESEDRTSVIQTVAGMTVKRAKKVWTNELGITIDAYLENDETIYVKVAGKEEEIKLVTTVGRNLIILKSLEGSLALTEEEIQKFHSLEKKDRYITIIKKKNQVEVGTIKLGLSNFEVEKPTFPSNEDSLRKFRITSEEQENVLTFIPIDQISGIREVRYEYTTKYTSTGTIETIYKNEKEEDLVEFDVEYMLANAKKATILEDGKVEIRVPKDIEAIYIALFDQAGNEARMLKNVRTPIYAGVSLGRITTNVTLNYVIRSNVDLEIVSVVTAISQDGKTFEEEKPLPLEKKENQIYPITMTITNPDVDQIWIKIVVKDAMNQTETRIEKLDVAAKAYEMLNVAVPGIIYEKNRYYMDSNQERAIIPAGFKVSSKESEQNIQEGLVIVDKQGNEYVWIPCTIDDTQNGIVYQKWGDESTGVGVDLLQGDQLPSGITDETEQIQKYGGFYVARYEASLPDAQTTEEWMKIKVFDADQNNRIDIGKAQSKANRIVWNQIDYEHAKVVAESVISNEFVQSTLVTGTMWDTMCQFIQTAGYSVVNDSSSWGNYYTKDGYQINGYYRTQIADGLYEQGSYTKSVAGYLLLPTGKFGSSVPNSTPKNIYDVAGNMAEWNLEKYQENKGVVRGGSFADQTNLNAMYREGNTLASNTASNIGFRFALFVK